MRLPMFMLLPILWSPLIAQEAQTRVTVSGETIRSMKQTVSVTSD